MDDILTHEEYEVREESIATETRDVLNPSGVKIGELTLPADSTEDVWTSKLSLYNTAIPAKPIQQIIQEKSLSPAKEFAKKIIDELTTENILMGITSAGKTELIANTVEHLWYHLNTGSLYVSENYAGSIELTEEMAPFLTAERITSFRNKIRLYLGMDLIE